MLYKVERQRAERVLSDVADLILNPADNVPLNEREEMIVAKLIAYYGREEPYQK